MPGAWEKNYYEMAHGDFSKENDWRIKKTADYLLNELKPGNKILEIGCGTAGLVGILPEDVHYTGIDVSDYALENARNRSAGRNNVKIEKADASSLPYDKEYFDFVVCFFTLEHLDKPKESLMEMKRVLKRGGSIILMAPNLELPLCFPTALRHKNTLFKIKFFLIRIFDYITRILGIYNFRILSDNYFKVTGKYEKKDDDLVYLASSFEVINFLKRIGFAFEFISSPEKERSMLRKLINFLPAMKYYGTELFVIAKKI